MEFLDQVFQIDLVFICSLIFVIVNDGIEVLLVVSVSEVLFGFVLESVVILFSVGNVGCMR